MQKLRFNLTIQNPLSDYQLKSLISELKCKMRIFDIKDFIVITNNPNEISIYAEKEIQNILNQENLFILCGDFEGCLDELRVVFQIKTFDNQIGYLEFSELSKTEVRAICTQSQTFYSKKQLQYGDFFVDKIKQEREAKKPCLI